MTTKIEWTDETWNPVTGCTKVSQGCKNCYAERLWPKVSAAEAKREGAAAPRPFTQIRCHPDRLNQPLRSRKSKLWFVNSMSDLFHEDVPEAFIRDVFHKMELCATGTFPANAQQTFQVLTKRPERMLDFMRRYADEHMGPPQNVWLGVSVEDQATADERIPLLLQTPAAVRFLSCEPVLGPIDLTGEYLADRCGGRYPFPNLPREHRTTRIEMLDWVIAGGESGPRARPSHPDWFRSLRDQCAAAGVAFFFKQWGAWWPISQMPDGVSDQFFDPKHGKPDRDEYDSRPKARAAHSVVLQLDGRQEFAFPAGAMTCFNVGKKAAGRTLDGRTHDEFPDTRKEAA